MSSISVNLDLFVDAADDKRSTFKSPNRLMLQDLIGRCKDTGQEKPEHDKAEKDVEIIETQESEEASANVEKEHQHPKVKATTDTPFHLGLTSVLRRQFKITGQVGELNQKDKLSYTSLVRQIEASMDQEFTEKEIREGVIRAISPGLVLTSYLETSSDLTLNRVRKIIRSHYGVKDTTEMYQNLA